MLLLCLALFPELHAAEKSTILKVGQSGAYLYLQNDTKSEKIATLPPGTELSLVIQTTGESTWFMVKTQAGQTGWVSAQDVEPIESAKPPAGTDEAVIKFGPSSTWSANIRDGGFLSGTWTGTIDRTAGAAMGSWTLRDGADRIVLSGSWSAVKSSGVWQGSWRASVKGQTSEHSGTWISELRLGPNLPFANLFQYARNQAITGTWQSGGRSGRWSIRVAR
jgi:hypothetical protein